MGADTMTRRPFHLILQELYNPNYRQNAYKKVRAILSKWALTLLGPQPRLGDKVPGI